MPRYEFRCRECTSTFGVTSTFEVARPTSAAGDPAACPHGHTDTVKLLSTVAVARGGGGQAAAPAASGGGCCGGSCCG